MKDRDSKSIPPHEPEEGCISLEELRKDVETARSLRARKRRSTVRKSHPRSKTPVVISPDRPQEPSITPEDLREEVRRIRELFG